MPHRAPSHRPPRLAGPPPTGERPTAAARGYGHRWQRLRRLILAGEPLCRQCRSEGRLVPAVHVDHIQAREKGGSDDTANLQPLCASCHSRKTATEDGGFGRRRN
jgi:5-methylcytosine-specific restriction protein A